MLVSNLTLLCKYQHGEFANRVWQCMMNRGGPPGWAPPAWRDPAQKPLWNQRIAQRT